MAYALGRPCLFVLLVPLAAKASKALKSIKSIKKMQSPKSPPIGAKASKASRPSQLRQKHQRAEAGITFDALALPWHYGQGVTGIMGIMVAPIILADYIGRLWARAFPHYGGHPGGY